MGRGPSSGETPAPTCHRWKRTPDGKLWNPFRRARSERGPATVVFGRLPCRRDRRVRADRAGARLDEPAGSPDRSARRRPGDRARVGRRARRGADRTHAAVGQRDRFGDPARSRRDEPVFGDPQRDLGRRCVQHARLRRDAAGAGIRARQRAQLPSRRPRDLQPRADGPREQGGHRDPEGRLRNPERRQRARRAGGLPAQASDRGAASRSLLRGFRAWYQPGARRLRRTLRHGQPTRVPDQPRGREPSPGGARRAGKPAIRQRLLRFPASGRGPARGRVRKPPRAPAQRAGVRPARSERRRPRRDAARPDRPAHQHEQPAVVAALREREHGRFDPFPAGPVGSVVLRRALRRAEDPYQRPARVPRRLQQRTDLRVSGLLRQLRFRRLRLPQRERAQADAVGRGLPARRVRHGPTAPRVLGGRELDVLRGALRADAGLQLGRHQQRVQSPGAARGPRPPRF